MKITFVLAANDFSGGCQVIVKISRILMERGHDVKIVCPRRPVKSLKVFLRDLVKGRKFSLRYSQIGHADEIRDSLVYVSSRTPIAPDKIPHSDVVIATWYETADWIAAIPPGAGAKLYFMMDYGAPNMPMERVVPTWRYPFVFVTLTNALATMIRNENEGSEIFVMKCAIAGEPARAAERRKPQSPRIGLVYGALSSKGMALAFSALALAKRKNPDLQVVCFGRHRPDDLPEYAEFFQDLTDGQRRDVYKDCTAWLFPSLLEGFGLPIIEAMAVGTPVIATRAGAAPDLVVTGQNGILLDTFEPEEMADAILAMGHMPEHEWCRMSDQALSTVTNHTWDDAVNVFERACFAAVDSCAAGGTQTGSIAR